MASEREVAFRGFKMSRENLFATYLRKISEYCKKDREELLLTTIIVTILPPKGQNCVISED